MDQTLFHFINERWTNHFLDLFMAGISDVDIWRPILVIIFLGALIFGGFRARACICCLFLSLFVAQQVTHALKSAIHRSRPKQVQTVRLVQLAKAHPEFRALFKKPIARYSGQSDRTRSDPSFPSGHMTNNTVIAVCLTLFYGRRGALYWIVDAAMAYSRIYLGAHWPSDVVGTLFLAAGETLLVVAALELAWKWIASKWMPAIFERHPSLIINPSR
jgi:undecaprenyl-diphosphatase